MTSKLIKIYFFTILLLSDFVLFAQDDEDPGNGFDDGGTVEDPIVPINTQMIWLLLMGIAFAFYYFRKLQLKK